MIGYVTMIFEKLPVGLQEFIVKSNPDKILTTEQKDNFALALIHRSWAVENNLEMDNERLEFLGDAVLELAVTSILFTRFSEESEGFMSKVRASFVNEVTLSQFAENMGFHEKVLLGKGESKSGGAQKSSILSSALEAWIGAFFLAHGYDETRALIENFYNQIKGQTTLTGSLDYKSELQEWTQKHYRMGPSYVVIEERGPDHQKTFFVGVYLNSKMICSGEGTSKKKAEREAAKLALDILKSSDSLQTVVDQ